ncbi:MAG: DNA-binding protein [Nitrospirota bacterium]|nr:DNA-binding protein [Nitrospirota bacterium]
MEEGFFKFYDIFATKGNDYLFVVGILIAVFLFWRFLNMRPY